MEEEKEERGFTISDKRFSAKEESAPPAEQEREETPERPIEEEPLEEGKAPFDESADQEPATINFVTFLFSMSNNVLFHLGELQEQGGGEVETNLPMARQTIDILNMLEEKTKGNLTDEEATLLKDLLYDLKMRYVNKAEA